jgi:hypothetical protein
MQPALSAALLRRLREIGHPGLDKLKINSSLPPERSPAGTPGPGSTLSQFIDFGVREVSLAPFVLELVLSELSSQKE